MSQLGNMKVADIIAAASGDNTAIAAVSGTIIRVWQIAYIANAAVNTIFKHGTTAFNANAWPLTAQGSAIVFDYTGQPWFSTLPGEAFVINLSGNVQTFGQIYYTLG